MLHFLLSPDDPNAGGGSATPPPPPADAAAAAAAAVAPAPPSLQDAGDAFVDAANKAGAADGTPAAAAEGAATDGTQISDADAAAAGAGDGAAAEGAEGAVTAEERAAAEAMANDPEIQAMVEEASREYDQTAHAMATQDAWASTLTPQTAQWLEECKTKMQQDRAAAETAATLAKARHDLTPEELTKIADANKIVQPIEFKTDDKWKDKIDLSKPYQPAFITAEDIKRQYGIDPDAVPAAQAAMITDLVARHNKMVANATFLASEAGKALAKRDESKAETLKVKFTEALKDNGYTVDDDAYLVLDKVKGALHISGVPQPWSKVLEAVSAKHPNALRKAPATTGTVTNPAAAETAAATAAGAPAARKPVLGSRAVTDQAAPAVQTKPALTLSGASDDFTSAAIELSKRKASGR